jgi:DNA-directed RNA polymerase II subunit RPB2
MMAHSIKKKYFTKNEFKSATMASHGEQVVSKDNEETKMLKNYEISLDNKIKKSQQKNKKVNPKKVVVRRRRKTTKKNEHIEHKQEEHVGENTINEVVQNEIQNVNMEIKNEEFNYDQRTAFTIIHSYFNQNTQNSPLYSHQIDSYNDFVRYNINRIIQQTNPVKVYYDDDELGREIDIDVTFGDIKLQQPTILENNGVSIPMFPNIAKLRRFTYSGAMLIDITFDVYVREEGREQQRFTKTMSNINIGKLPIMVNSDFCLLKNYPNYERSELGECPNDPGGYFIINGGERVIVSQERMAQNMIFVYAGGKSSKYSYLAEIKSVPHDQIGIIKGFSMKIMNFNSTQCIRINMPKVRADVPIVVMFRALGIEDEHTILRMIFGDLHQSEYRDMLLFMRMSIEDNMNIYTQEQAIEYLSGISSVYGPKRGDFTRETLIRNMLHDDLLPHLGKNYKKKAIFMGHMCLELLKRQFNKLPTDDRDSYTNKRVENTGMLLSTLFQQYWNNKMIKDIRSFLNKEIKDGSWASHNNFEGIVNDSNIHKIVKSTTLETGMKYALATGNFGMKNVAKRKKVGISQLMSRMNQNDTISHIRRINTPIDKSGKLVAPRKLHATQWGFVCPSETPEGASVGVVKNIASMATITSVLPIERIFRIAETYVTKLEDIEGFEYKNQTKVIINGDWIGITEEPEHLYQELRHYKRRGIIHPFTSVVFKRDKNNIEIWNDGGRMVRPLLIVDSVPSRDENGYLTHSNKLRLEKYHIDNIKSGHIDWNQLLTNIQLNTHENNMEGLIEYVDAIESEYLMIAMDTDNLKNNTSYTHMEIHPCSILGTLASIIPFPDHNQSPRNTYQSAMGKQAMGIYAMNFLKRMDTAANVLLYPQRPLVYTKMSEHYLDNKMPNGMNAIVAIMTWTGYNQEDSVLLNKSAVERGLFRSFYYRTYQDEEKKNSITGEEEKFCKPDPRKTIGIKYGNYGKLNEHGYIPLNEKIEKNDIIVGKVTPLRTKGRKTVPTRSFNKEFRDVSRTIRTNEQGYIDYVYKNVNADGYNFMKIRIRSERIPSIGDKFSSRHGQKGTCGMIVPQEDMPRMPDGTTPDIIVNPHAIPSRMTIGHLLECVLGKACVMNGTYGDGSPFQKDDNIVETIGDLLENSGMERYGNEILYNGKTGDMMPTTIFMGPTFYQRLKHMVDDKVHSRSSGPIMMLTRQPAEGRSRDGGLRFGEMERDCMISHGASIFTKERMLNCSDYFKAFVSDKNGLISKVNEEEGKYNDIIDYMDLDERMNHTEGQQNLFTRFSGVEMAYAYKLFTQQMESMNVSMRLFTDIKQDSMFIEDGETKDEI